MGDIKKRSLRWLVAVVAAAILFAVVSGTSSQAAVGINSQINFEGKVVNTNGTNLPDGTYNMEFKVYQDGTSTGVGSTLKWTETRLVSGGNGVTVTAGTFQVNLGSVTAFASNIDWNQDTLWLSMNVGGTAGSPVWDGEMSPYIRLTSVPYALNAGMVGGLTASQLVQLTPASQQSGGINVSGNIKTGGTLQATTVDAASSGTLTVGSTNTTAITLGKTTTINGSATAALSIMGVVNTSAFASAASLILDNAATSTQNVIALNVAGTTKSSIRTDSLGNLVMSPVGNGALYLNNDGGTGGVFIGSSAAPVSIFAYNSLVLNPSTTVPTTDQLIIDNTSSTGVTTAGVNGANIKFKGGAAAVESAGMRIDFQPGGTSGGTWSGLRIVANATGAAAGVNQYGIKLEGPSSPGAGTEEGLYIGSGWDIGIDVASGGLQLAVQNTPATPAAGQLRVFAQSIGGRVMPKWLSPSGVNTPFQSNFGFNRIAMLMPSGNANMTTFGTTITTVGTISNPAPASTNFTTATRRLRITSAALAGSFSSAIPSGLMNWRGNASGLGGFFMTMRFNFSTLQAGNRAFMGMADSVAAATNVDPTTATTPGKFGIAINANSGNLKWVNNVTGTAPTAVDLGASFPVDVTSSYELIMFSPPNGGSITYRVTNLSTGNATADTVVSANIPASATFLAPQMWMTNNAAVAAVAFDSAGWYLESDN